MGKIRYLIYGSIIVGFFIILHWIFPRDWSLWLRNMDQLFTTPPLGFQVLVAIGVFFFFAFVFLWGIAFIASFGKVHYPLGSENYHPPISVLIPALNEEKVIGATLDCFKKSSYPKENLDFVIIASGSTDETVAICKRYQNDLNIQILTDPLPKRGKPAALNLGLKYSKHDILCIYDADNHVEENTLEYLVRPLYDPTADAAIGPVSVQNRETNKITKAIAIEYTFLSGAGLYFELRQRLGRQLWLFSRNVCIRKRVIEEVGGWKEDALAEDMHLSVQLAMLKKQVKHSPLAYCSERAPTDWESFKKQRQRWIGGHKSSMKAAMEIKRSAVVTRNFGMSHYAHINNYALGAVVTALIFGLVVKDYFVMLICITIFIFTFGMGVNGIRKYGNRRYRLLLYYPVFFVTNLYMFSLTFRNLKSLEWEKTEK